MVDFDVLKRVLEEKGYTISSLERAANVGNGTIGKWKSRKQKPKLETLQKIVSVLGCSIDELVRKDVV